ncbi:MAG: hypothetical protein JWQ81_6033 [Amycolatopsis sp.]|uniref:septum formation family protein n=1 Tax=Amycolatopsis sp. TaxID=37632 RepID=UPI002607D7F4|nr:septum formation family protein [Amycolatopsis sp.]MCU1685294.1 hypothetical protein [Amycolatopsis sp.]
MLDPILTGLLEVAGPQLYRRNAFRITGLPTDADRRTVRHRQQKVVPALVSGADVDLGHSLPVGADEVRAAFDRILGDPRRRLVDELFWKWDTPDATCGCSQNLHRGHDAAVKAHSTALDREATGGKRVGKDLERLEKLWKDAAQEWRQLLRRTVFWDHLRHRIIALDDRQLDESVIDLLRDELPVALVKPLIQLAVASPSNQTRLADLARAWPAPSGVVADQLEAAAEPFYQAAKAAITKAMGHIDAGQFQYASTIGYEEVLPALARLDPLVPHRLHRRTADVRNEVAVLFNNCATGLMEELGPAADDSSRRWFTTATELATDPRTTELIKQNRATLAEIVAVFETIKARVAEFVSLGRPDLAKSTLRNLKRQLRGAPGASEIDRLLDELSGRTPRPANKPPVRRPASQRPVRNRYQPQSRPKYRRVRYQESVGSRVGSFVAFLVILGLVVLGVYAFWQGGTAPKVVTATVYSESVKDDAPVGTCIATQQGWDNGRSDVPVVPCDQPHWGEVVGYPAIAPSPAPYPGKDQTAALAQFECLSLVSGLGLSHDLYTGAFNIPASVSWNSGGRPFENYTPCVVHRIDGKQLPGEQLVDPYRKPANLPTPMDMFARDISSDPPVGACVQTKQVDGVSPVGVPIVRCDQPHWAQILGYPALYQPDAPWPGAAAVTAAADAACQGLANSVTSSGHYTYHVTSPDHGWWVHPQAPIYAICTMSQSDDKPFTGGLS